MKFLMMIFAFVVSSSALAKPQPTFAEFRDSLDLYNQVAAGVQSPDNVLPFVLYWEAATANDSVDGYLIMDENAQMVDGRCSLTLFPGNDKLSYEHDPVLEIRCLDKSYTMYTVEGEYGIDVKVL